ncbi:MAG: hypothetical protein ABEL76_07405 [Bradymonadaceae bacterium]
MSNHRQPGTCELCGVELSATDMTDHLPECIEHFRREFGPIEDEDQTAYVVAFHSDRAPLFWLRLLVRGDARLAQIDAVLRELWMEENGQHSRFVVGSDVYTSGDPTELQRVAVTGDLSPQMDEVFPSDEPFEYHYDLGATTELTGRVTNSTLILPDAPDESVRLLARNNPPEIPCACGRRARYVCPECADDREGWFCGVCAEDHPCRSADDGYPPIGNSPRAARG